ncbi:MAG: hypothetical protein HC802_18375 [Caldilineaceae bacterium]|nr:hypothetical protein [Caldilineaceae bacterium]
MRPGAIAPAVAEMTLLLILLCLRQVHRLDRQLKAGEAWHAVKPEPMGQELAGRRVGVVGAGYTGRCVIGLLTALNAEVWVHDPYLSPARAAELGVRKAGLDELFAQCPVVTMQAPPTEETRHMVGAAQLRLLQDGAIFVNTARSLLVDRMRCWPNCAPGVSRRRWMSSTRSRCRWIARSADWRMWSSRRMWPVHRSRRACARAS